MKKQLQLLLILLVSALFLVTAAYADGPKPGVKLLDSDASGLTLLLTSDFQLSPDSVNGVACQRLAPVGSDAPIHPLLLAAPPRATISVDVEPLDIEPLSGMLCSSLSADEDIQALKSVPVPARIVDLGFMRSQRIIRLETAPLQRNASGQAVYYKSMRVHIDFRGDVSGATISEPETFESSFSELLVNYETARHLRGAQASPPQIGAWSPPSPAWRILVNTPGVYELTYQDMKNAGLPVESLDPHTLRVLNFGKEVAIAVTGEADSRLDKGDVLLFYGQGVNTRYTDTNVYWLTYGHGSGLRIAEQPSAANAAVVASYRASSVEEENRFYVPSLPMTNDHDHWFGLRIDIYGQGAIKHRDYQVNVTNLASGPHQAQLTVALGGNANASHHLRLYINGNPIHDDAWQGRIIYKNTISFSQSHLHVGQNTVRIEMINDAPGQTIDQIYVDWLRLDYQRNFVAEANVLTFESDTGGAHTFQVDGFSTPNLELFDISDPDRVRQITGWQAVATGGGLYRLQFNDASATSRHYWAQAQIQRRKPLAIQRKEPPTIPLTSPENGVDYIAIYPPDFEDALKPLMDHRQSQGLRVMAVSTQDIYDEFGYGMMSAEAIHDFLAYAYRYWQTPAPAFVLLIGDGTYDMRHYLPNSADTFLPPYLVSVDPTLGEAAADNRFVTITADDILPDMYVGRLPANSPTEVSSMVAKILTYEQTTANDAWTHNILFVTDNLEGGGGNFYDLSDGIADGYVDPPANTTKLIPERYQRNKLYLDRTCSPGSDCRQKMTTTLNNDGALFVSYIGHGTKTFWAREKIWDVAAASQMNNGNQLPIMLPMTCNEGYFYEAAQDAQSTSEAAVRLPGNGAVASWAPTGYGLSSGHDYLEKGFFLSIFHGFGQRLGVATTDGKLYLAANAPPGSYLDLIDTFLLLGDPALVLPVEAAHPADQLFLPIMVKE